MIKGVVFDLDHTLFDRYSTLRKIAPAMIEGFGDKISCGVDAEKFADALVSADKKHIHFGFEKVIEYLYKAGIFKNPISVEEYTEVLYKNFAKVAVPFSFTESVLEKLLEQGYKLGLITNGRSKIQSAKIGLLGIEKYFDEIIISGDLGIHKPDRRIFDIFAKKINLNPCEMLYVGDNPVNDVDASRKAGYIPVWVKTTGEWLFPEIERCRYEIDTVEELPDLLNKIR
ncbi:MAG: HAD family hydrolase [Clostridia bacterium]|nr:HAD family hydrolase [Clostridia bacterium]